MRKQIILWTLADELFIINVKLCMMKNKTSTHFIDGGIYLPGRQKRKDHYSSVLISTHYLFYLLARTSSLIFFC